MKNENINFDLRELLSIVKRENSSQENIEDKLPDVVKNNLEIFVKFSNLINVQNRKEFNLLKVSLNNSNIMKWNKRIIDGKKTNEFEEILELRRRAFEQANVMGAICALFATGLSVVFMTVLINLSWNSARSVSWYYLMIALALFLLYIVKWLFENTKDVLNDKFKEKGLKKYKFDKEFIVEGDFQFSIVDVLYREFQSDNENQNIVLIKELEKLIQKSKKNKLNLINSLMRRNEFELIRSKLVDKLKVFQEVEQQIKLNLEKCL